MAEEYCWAITGGETVMLRQTSLQCVLTCSCTRLVDYLCFEIRLAQNLPEPLRKLGSVYTVLGNLYLHAHLRSKSKHSCQQLSGF